MIKIKLGSRLRLPFYFKLIKMNTIKKSIVLLVLLGFFVSSAKAQWFDFSQNNKDFTIGVNVGAVGYDFANGQINKTYSDLGVGLSLSMAGIYLDFIYQSPEHRMAREIAPIVYHDHTALTINLGYKIPVRPWLNITPMVGYSNETTGITDCSTLIIESNELFHSYECEDIYNHFNYGLGISVKPINWLEIGGVCTSHAVYGNLSVNLFSLKNN